MIKGLSPMDELDDVVRAVKTPVQAVGGLTIKQAIECPAHGANLVVLGAPLVIDGEGFKPAGNNLFDILKEICGEIRKTPMRRPT
jgi:3-hexulose-6-phosphate synthase